MHQVPPGGPRREWGYRVLQGAGQLVMGALTRPVWEGMQNVPTGPALIVSNHISNADPVVLGHALVAAGHVPRYMAKRELFDVPALGALLRSAGQIPVTRVAGRAGAAYEAALAALEAGEQVVVYPEGTLTRDPDGWPMRGKTGVARLALQTRVPVIPVGQWGAQEVWPAGARSPQWGRREVRVARRP